MMDKREFCRLWFEKGVCPGCGALLEQVAGQGVCHYRSGQPVYKHGRLFVTTLGQVVKNYGRMAHTDPRLCKWKADDLAMLCHIGEKEMRRVR